MIKSIPTCAAYAALSIYAKCTAQNSNFEGTVWQQRVRMLRLKAFIEKTFTASASCPFVSVLIGHHKALKAIRF